MPVSNAAAQYMQRIDDTLLGDQANSGQHYKKAFIRMLANSELSTVFIVGRNPTARSFSFFWKKVNVAFGL
jgi:hypothetical protein